MIVNVFDGTEWAIIFGIITLVCWIVAGITEVASTWEESEQTGKKSTSHRAVTVMFATLGLMSVLVMLAGLVAK